MNRKPLVTVLMGSYNPRWDRLRRAVESLRRQTLEDWELSCGTTAPAPGAPWPWSRPLAWTAGCACTGAGKTAAWAMPSTGAPSGPRAATWPGWMTTTCATPGGWSGRSPFWSPTPSTAGWAAPPGGWTATACGAAWTSRAARAPGFRFPLPLYPPRGAVPPGGPGAGLQPIPPVPGLRGLPAVPAAAPAGLAGVQLALAPAGLLGGQGLLPPPGHGPPPAGGRSPPGGAGCLGPAVALSRLGDAAAFGGVPGPRGGAPLGEAPWIAPR